MATPLPSRMIREPHGLQDEILAVGPALQRILDSKTFSRSDRLRRFLRFAVEKVLEGRGSSLKETVIALEVYDRPTDYDPRIDPIVRVEARRLRSKLGRYYGYEGRGEPLRITFVKGSYAPRLRVRTLRESRRLLAGTRDAEAGQLYLRGRYVAHREDADGLRKSLVYFRRSLRRDPQFAPAHAGLALSLASLAFHGPMNPLQVMPAARRAARRALAFAPRLPEAHTALAATRALYEWRWQEAERGFLRAIAIDADYPNAHHLLGMTVRAPMGRLEEAIAEVERSLELEPASLIANFSLALLRYMAGDCDGAVKQASQTIDLDPASPPAHLFLALAHAGNGRHHEAIEALERVARASSHPSFIIGALAQCHAMAGRLEPARQLLEQILLTARRAYVPPFDIARIFVALGESEPALDWLEKAVAGRCSRIVWMGVHPVFEPLRAHPRFRALLRKVRLPVPVESS